MSVFNRHRKELYYEYTPDKKTPISSCIDDNITIIKELFKDANDMVFRDFKVGGPDGTHMFLAFIDGMANNDRINGDVVEPMMIFVREVEPHYQEIKDRLYEVIKDSALGASDFKEIDILEDSLIQVLSGDTALFIDGSSKAIIISSKFWPARGPDEPSGEMVIRGPRDGFVESLRSNTALIRRRIRDVRLKVKQSQCGVRSRTDIAIVYIDDIVDKDVLESVEKRIKGIDIDAILESGYIEQFLDDRKISPFPRVQSTERPDVVAAALYEGRVGIVVDNSPFVLIVPVTLNALLQSA
jgi:spore germination protein